MSGKARHKARQRPAGHYACRFGASAPVRAALAALPVLLPKGDDGDDTTTLAQLPDIAGDTAKNLADKVINH